MSAFIPSPEPQPSAAREWLTLPGRKTVLVVAHTVTYTKRLLDVISLLDSDFRIQVVFSVPPHELGDGVHDFLRRLGSAVLPWEEAVRMPFDLALAAGPRGVAHLQAPLITLPHGANYLKKHTATPTTHVFGLTDQDLLLEGGKPPSAVVVPHVEDLRALTSACPTAGPVAHVVGDPAHDRIVRSLPHRGAYRRALGLSKRQKLLVLTSTWGPRASFGRFETLLPRLGAELGDDYRAAVLIHPNVWSGHGPRQIRAWLARCNELGITLVPPEEDWRSLLVSADWIIGDHGSVTLYGTLTRAPILLAASPEEEINPESPAASLAALAPVLSASHPLSTQLRYAKAEYRRPEYEAVAARITSEPRRFNRNMRALMYRSLGLGQPAHPPLIRPLPPPRPLVPRGDLPYGYLEASA